MLRWSKNDLTVCIDPENSFIEIETLKDILIDILDQISSIVPLRFTMVESLDCDITIKFREIDGPGQTLAFVSLPTQSDLVDSCDCGDVTVDIEDPLSSELLYVSLAHEIGHSLGIREHAEDVPSIMNPFLNSGFVGTKIADDNYYRNELLVRYGSDFGMRVNFE